MIILIGLICVILVVSILTITRERKPSDPDRQLYENRKRLLRERLK